MMMIIYFVIGCSQFNILASVSRLTWYVILNRRLLLLDLVRLTHCLGHLHAIAATRSRILSQKCTPLSASLSTPSWSHRLSVSSSTSFPSVRPLLSTPCKYRSFHPIFCAINSQLTIHQNLALHSRTLLLLRNASSPRYRPKARGPLPSTWSMELGQMGHAHQLRGIRMGGLLCDLPAIPTFLACDWRVDELRWSYHGRYHLHSAGRLVHAWT
jgi:hypothetical protein